VAQVVKQDRESQRLAEARPVVRIQRELRRDSVEHLGGHRHGAKAMGVAGVRGAGKRQVAKPSCFTFRSRWYCGLSTSARSSGVSSMAPWMGSRMCMAWGSQAPASIRASSSGKPWYLSRGYVRNTKSQIGVVIP